MRDTVRRYCAALEQGDFLRTVELIDPEDRLAFWQAMSDIQETLNRVGEIGSGMESVPFYAPGRRIAEQDATEYL